MLRYINTWYETEILDFYHEPLHEAMDDFFQKYTDEILEDKQVIAKWERYDEHTRNETGNLDDDLPNSLGWDLKNGLRTSLNIQLKENYGSHINENKLVQDLNKIPPSVLFGMHPEWIQEGQEKILLDAEIKRTKCEQVDINFYIMSVPFSLKAITLQNILKIMNKGVEEEFMRRKQKYAHKLIMGGNIFNDVAERYKIDHLHTKRFSNQDVCNLLKNKPELFGEIVKNLLQKLHSNAEGVMEANIVKSSRLEVLKCTHCEKNIILNRGNFTYCKKSHITCNHCLKHYLAMKTKQKLETVMEVCSANLYKQKIIMGNKSKEGRCIKCRGELKRGNFPGGRSRTRFFWRSSKVKSFKLTTR